MKNMNNDTMESGGDNGELVLQTVKLVLLALQEAKAITIDWASIGDNGVYARILGTNGTILHEFQGWGRLTYMVDRCLENTRSPELISVIMTCQHIFGSDQLFSGCIKSAMGTRNEKL